MKHGRWRKMGENKKKGVKPRGHKDFRKTTSSLMCCNTWQYIQSSAAQIWKKVRVVCVLKKVAQPIHHILLALRRVLFSPTSSICSGDDLLLSWYTLFPFTLFHSCLRQFCFFSPSNISSQTFLPILYAPRQIIVSKRKQSIKHLLVSSW